MLQCFLLEHPVNRSYPEAYSTISSTASDISIPEVDDFHVFHDAKYHFVDSVYLDQILFAGELFKNFRCEGFKTNKCIKRDIEKIMRYNRRTSFFDEYAASPPPNCTCLIPPFNCVTPFDEEFVI